MKMRFISMGRIENGVFLFALTTCQHGSIARASMNASGWFAQRRRVLRVARLDDVSSASSDGDGAVQ